MEDRSTDRFDTKGQGGHQSARYVYPPRDTSLQMHAPGLVIELWLACPKGNERHVCLRRDQLKAVGGETKINIERIHRLPFRVKKYLNIKSAPHRKCSACRRDE